MKNTNVQEIILDALIKIKQENWRNGSICLEVNILCCFKGVLKELGRIFKLWPKHSGSTSFPVPSCHTDPNTAFMEAVSMWKGEYGQNRIELLDFCLTYLGTELWKTYSLKADC